MNKLELTDDQLQLVSRALEMYARASIGQLDKAAELSVTVQSKVWNMSTEDRTEFSNSMLRCGELVTGMRKHATYGIYNEKVNDDARLAAHINQSIRHEFWKRGDMKNTSTVNAHPADIVKGLVIKIEKI